MTMARLIDADGMKNAIREWQKSSTNFRTLEEVVDGQPTIDPVKHGRWNEVNACNLCGCSPWFERDIHTLNFCPKCGAKMDGD